METNASSSMDCSDESIHNIVEDRNDSVDQDINMKDMVFDSIDELYDKYRIFGMKKGFGVAKRSSTKVDGVVIYTTIGCSRAGRSQNTSQNLLKPYPTSKTNCKAKLQAKRIEIGKWLVTSFTDEHNHVLSPGKSRNYRCNRKLTAIAKRKLVLNDVAGIRMNKNFNALVIEAGGHENLPFVEKDCRNYIEKVRRLKLGEGDASALQSYFKKVQSIDSNFFYTIDYDEDNRIKNLFWADARCRAAYEEFGDVITFDTTYLTNKYDMPFAPFVGVNHHGQSILLGCGLISSEDTESFMWLFDSWLTCMNDKHPNAIITDQDRAMQNAIQIIFPNICHRWCLWHILKKIPEKLRGHANYDSMKSCMLHVVYDSLTLNDFELGWSGMIERYSLENNDWLHGLYVERQHWVPAFIKNYFWAGMSTTQRSEGMNAFFDGYVNSKTTLKQFVSQYDNALQSKVIKEQEADFKSFNSWIPCVTFYAMEKQVQKVYTISKFKQFQHELTCVMYCKITTIKAVGGVYYYEISELQHYGDNNEQMRRVKFNVSYIKEEGDEDTEIKCICKSFEFCGILCRHVILVLIENNIFNVPTKYILRRWRKDIKRRHTKTRVTYCDWKDTNEGRRYDRMCTVFNEIADLSYDDDDKCNLVIKQLEDLKLDIASRIASTSNNSSEKVSRLSESLLSPIVKRSKGRPPFKRKQSKVEQVINKLRKRNSQAFKSSTRRKQKEVSKSPNQTLTFLETNVNVHQSCRPLDNDLNEFDHNNHLCGEVLTLGLMGTCDFLSEDNPSQSQHQYNSSAPTSFSIWQS